MKFEKSRTSPTLISRIIATQRSFTSGHSDFGTYTRLAALHFCPWYSKPPRTIPTASAAGSADVEALAVAIVRGGFEYQGQKCSAASRIYVPQSLWPTVKGHALDMMKHIKMGDPRDFRNFMGAVIDEKAFKDLIRAAVALNASRGKAKK